MLFRRWLNVSGGALLLTAASLATASSAQADDTSTTVPDKAPSQAVAGFGPTYHMYTDDWDSGGRVDFEPNGDEVTLVDQEADGAHVEVDIWNVTHDPDTYEYGLSASPAGIAIHVNAADGQPYNMAEGHCFSFRIRLVDNGDVLEDSVDWARWRNYNDHLEECPGVD